jgi:uncharacterized protein (DUF849 family)
VPAPLVIQCAITGSIDPDPERRPNLPATPEAIVAEALAAWRAGAAVLHLHAREEDGTPTQDREAYRALVDALRDAGCAAIVNLSCGSAGGARSATSASARSSWPREGELRLRIDQLPRTARDRARPADRDARRGADDPRRGRDLSLVAPLRAVIRATGVARS